MFSIRGKNKSAVWPISESQDTDNGAHNIIPIPTDDFVTRPDNSHLKSSSVSIGTIVTSTNHQSSDQVHQNSEENHNLPTIDVRVSSRKTKADQDLRNLKRFVRHWSTLNDLEVSQGNYKNIRDLSDSIKSNKLIKADILFVAGGITALIGFTIAAMGIYPRNQVGIRLYLEIFGCLMVIVGVVMVLYGMRFRLLEKNTLFNDFNHINHRCGACQTINQSTMVRPASIIHQRFDVESNDDISTIMEFRIDHYPTVSRKDYETLLGPSQATIADGLSLVLTVCTLIAVRKNMSCHCCLHQVTKHVITSHKHLMGMWKNLFVTSESSDLICQRKCAKSTLQVTNTET